MEADLAFRGVDLGHLWRSRQWRKLLNLIDHLPGHSLYAEAVSQDEVAAQAYLDSDSPAGTVASPRLSDFTPETAALAAVFDRLADVISATVAAAGGKPPKTQPYPRPVPATSRVRRRKALDRHQRLVSQLLRTP